MSLPFEQKIIAGIESTKKHLESLVIEMKSGKPNKCLAPEFSIEELEHNFDQTITAYSSFKIVAEATAQFAEQLTINDQLINKNAELMSEVADLKDIVQVLKTESEKILKHQNEAKKL